MIFYTDILLHIWYWHTADQTISIITAQYTLILLMFSTIWYNPGWTCWTFCLFLFWYDLIYFLLSFISLYIRYFRKSFILLTCKQKYVLLYTLEVFQAGPDDSLNEVALKILQSGVATVPIIHSPSADSPNKNLLHLASLSGILKCQYCGPVTNGFSVFELFSRQYLAPCGY